jgi:hypothetical protein
MPEKVAVNKTLDTSLPLFCAQQPATVFMSSRINPINILPSVSLKSFSLSFQLRLGLLRHPLAPEFLTIT